MIEVLSVRLAGELFDDRAQGEEISVGVRVLCAGLELQGLLTHGRQHGRFRYAIFYPVSKLGEIGEIRQP